MSFSSILGAAAANFSARQRLSVIGHDDAPDDGASNRTAKVEIITGCAPQRGCAWGRL
jgi:hypothetical protein